MHTSASIIHLVSELSLTDVMCRLERLHDEWLARAEDLDSDGKRDALRYADVVGELLGALVREDRKALDAELTKARDAWVDTQTDYLDACETVITAADAVLGHLEALEAMVDNPPAIAAPFLIKLPEWRTTRRRSIRRTCNNKVDDFTRNHSVSDSEWFAFVSDTLPAAIDKDLDHYARLRTSQGRVVEPTHPGVRISQVRDGLRWTFYKRFDALLDSSDITQLQPSIEALKHHRSHLLATESHTAAAVANKVLRDLPVWSIVDQYSPAFADLMQMSTVRFGSKADAGWPEVSGGPMHSMAELGRDCRIVQSLPSATAEG